MRRANFQEGTVDYAAVGATQAHDLMGYPPEKSRPAEQSWRIGSGEDRFAAGQPVAPGPQFRGHHEGDLGVDAAATGPTQRATMFVDDGLGD